MERPIKIVMITGSARPNNYTAMAAALLADEFGKFPKVSLQVIHAGQLTLAAPGVNPNLPDAVMLQTAVKDAAAIVFATPEYHGSFSSVTKLAIENLGFPSLLAGKPIGLLGVAAGVIGAIKSLEHLRSVLAHVGAIVMPLLVSVPNVRTVFDEQGHCLNPQVEQQVRSVATTLMHYLEDAVCPRVTLEAMLRGEPVAAH
jgi:chromate reductase